MAMAIAHFAVGVLGTAVLARIAAPRFVRSPTVLFAGGIWAVLPDAHWVLPVGSDPVHALHRTVLSDLFWFHHLLDVVDPTNSRPVAAVVVAVVVIGLALTEWSLR